MDGVHMERLRVEDFQKCNNIWDMQKNAALAEQFYGQLLSGNRVTYVAVREGMLLAEASVVRDTGDADYTIPGVRAYFSRFLVKKSCRRQGLGTALAAFVFDRCRDEGFSQLSVGVDLANYDALRLYHRLGFDRLLFVGEDAGGRYVKLLKTL